MAWNYRWAKNGCCQVANLGRVIDGWAAGWHEHDDDSDYIPPASHYKLEARLARSPSHVASENMKFSEKCCHGRQQRLSSADTALSKLKSIKVNKSK